MKKLLAYLISLFAAIGILANTSFASDNLSSKLSKNNTTTYLFVLAAPQGSITTSGKQTTLSLSPIRHVMYFSDRPARDAGGMPMTKFLALWGQGKDSFKADAPNAALVSALSFDKVTKDYHIEKFVILSKPQYDEKNKTVSFAIAPIT